ncbi:MAG TPA: hypothetical protein VHE53_00640 [Patescibacteria group bacterium]|nr:hypothetical protein [Patescibacteria group bacterium]
MSLEIDQVISARHVTDTNNRWFIDESSPQVPSRLPGREDTVTNIEALNEFGERKNQVTSLIHVLRFGLENHTIGL